MAFLCHTKQFHYNKFNRFFHWTKRDLERHEKSSEGGQAEYLYPGNDFRPRMTVIEKLAMNYDIVVQEQDPFHPLYATFGWECLGLKNRNLQVLTPIPNLADYELPAKINSRQPIENVPEADRKHWLDIHTHYGVSWQCTTIYRPQTDDVGKILSKLAAKQRQCLITIDNAA